MVLIKDDLTLEDLQRVMSFSRDRNNSYESVVAAVHTLLYRPENIFYRDIGCGRKVWVARNNTIICPRTPEPTAWYLGGCRWKEYDSEGEAETDVRNLARGMSYKWAILNLMFSRMALDGRAEIEEVSASRMGGGKSVIFEPNYDGENFSRTDQPLTDLEKAVLRDKVVPVLRGLVQYIFAPDMGTRCAHVDFIAKYAPCNVACLPVESSGSGDPSVVTARGVYESLLESVTHHLDRDDLSELTIAIQGVGKVGSFLIEYITQDYPTADLMITDVDGAKVEEKIRELTASGINAKRVEPNEIYDRRFDVFSPNATGQTVNPSTVRRMVKANRDKKLIIVGGANNQIDERQAGRRREVEALLRECNILYAPDFVVNLGGILNLIYEFQPLRDVFGGGYNQERPLEVISGVRPILREIYESSNSLGLSTQSLAVRLAEEQIARWALFNGFSPDELIARDYLVDLMPKDS